MRALAFLWWRCKSFSSALNRLTFCEETNELCDLKTYELFGTLAELLVIASTGYARFQGNSICLEIK